MAQTAKALLLEGNIEEAKAIAEKSIKILPTDLAREVLEEAQTTHERMDKIEKAQKCSIGVAFIYGSVAKHEDAANSDIDVMIIGEDISYADLYPLLESANDKLHRQVNPICYTPEEWVRKQKEGNNFVMQVMNQPKIFIVGNDDDLASIR